MVINLDFCFSSWKPKRRNLDLKLKLNIITDKPAKLSSILILWEYLLVLVTLHDCKQASDKG